MRDKETLDLLRETAQILGDQDLTPEDRDRRADEALDALLYARFASEEIRLEDAAKDAALASLLAIAGETRVRNRRFGFSRGGPFSGGARPAPAWRYALATAVMAGALAAIWLALRHPRVQPEQIARTPQGKESTGPQRAPEPHNPRPVPRPDIRIVRRPTRRVPHSLSEHERRIVRRPNPPSDGAPVVALAKVGSITEVMGEPTCRARDDRVARTVSMGSIVYAATTLETGDADRATIRLKDGTTFRLGYNTTLRFPAVDGGQVGKMYELSSGSVYATVAQQPEGSNLAVRTPAATAQVVGTEFALRIRRRSAAHRSAAPETTLSVKEGTVVFYNDHGRVECSRMTESGAVPYAPPTAPRKIRYIRSFQNINLVVHTERLTLAECAERLMWEPGWTGLLVADRFVPGKPKPWELPLDVKEIPLLTAPTVVSVTPGSPAYRAGMRKGDVLLRIAGRPLRMVLDAELAIYAQPPSPLTVSYLRGKAARSAMLKTIRDPDWKYPRLPVHERRLVDAGIRLLLAGDARGAEAAYRRAIALTGGAAAYNNLGLMLEYEGRLPEAVKALKEAKRRRPRIALYPYNLGLALLAVGNPERAIESFENAARVAPKWEDPYEQLARTYIDRLDDVAGALAVVERWLRALPRSSVAWKSRAHALRVSCRLPEAMKAAVRATELPPDLSGGAYQEAADTYRALGNASRAQIMYGKALELSAGIPHFYSGIGIAFAEQGRLAEAVGATRYALMLEPEDFVFYGNISHFYKQLGKLQLAELAARRAIALEPRYGKGYEALCGALTETGRLAEAEAAARRCLEVSVDRSIALNALGIVLFAQNKPHEAETCFMESVALDPRFAAGYASLSGLYQRGGRLPEMEVSARKAAQLQPQNAKYQWGLGMALVGLKRFPEAEQYFRVAHAIRPEAPEYLGSIAAALRSQGKRAEAERLCLDGVRRFPTDPNTHFILASLYDELGRLEEAEREYRSATRFANDKVTMLGQLALAQSRRPGWADGGLAVAEECIALAHDGASRATAMGYLGLVRERRGERDKAEAAFRESVRLAANALRWNRLAGLLERTGRPAEAIEAYRKSLGLDPKDPAAQTALQRLGATTTNPP